MNNLILRQVSRNTISILMIFVSVILIQSCSTTDKHRFSKPAIPVELEDAYFAGFAFLGDWNQRNIRYPYTAEIANQKDSNGLSIIDTQLLDRMRGFDAKGYNLHKTLGDLKDGTGLSVAIAIAYEDVYVLPFDGDYKVSYDIGLNILVFDFIEKKVIAVYPLRFLRNELLKERPTEEQKKQVIKSLFISNNHGINVLEEAVNQMKKMIIRPSYGHYIGIRNVTVSEKALHKIPEEILQDNILKTQVAQQFEGFLSKNTFVPMVPYTTGEAIGRNMAARFSNGDSYDFKLPELDYFIDLELRDFKTKNRKDHTGFASLITLKVDTELSNVVDAKFSHVPWVLKGMTGDGSKESNWSVYEESLGGLFNSLAKQIASSDSEWLEKHSVTKNVDEQFALFRNVLIKSQ